MRSRSIAPASRTSALLVLALAAAGGAPGVAVAQEIPSPEEFFGHAMGEDRELAHWDELAEYYRLLDEASPRLQVVEMGPSTLGNPFFVLFVSAPENLERLDELKRMNATLSDPRGASEAEIEAAMAEGKAVIAQSFGLHSNEVAASQTAAELAWELVTREDEEMVRILDNTVSVLFPSLNPDGTGMITEWYRETVGTEYEGAAMPWLYHPYIGHDNNRDAFMQNTVESRYAAELLFREWVPQAYVDHHEMGGSSARFYIPPYAEPIRPDGDPLVWREMSWYGAHMGYRTQEEGIQGVVGAAIYSGWGHFGFHWITPFHNTAGMLTESARTGRLATPVYLHPDQLEGGRRQLPEYEAQTTFPDPWPGGWWRVRDIVEQQKVSALAVLDLAARHRETVLRNALLKAERQIARGEAAEPAARGTGSDAPLAAYIVPAEQHDPLTTAKMVDRLLWQGVEVARAEADFTHEGRVYGAGSYVVPMAQPKRGVVRWLLGRTFYPDNEYNRDRDGDPIRPYDMSADNIAEFMGVRVDPVETVPEVATRVLEGDVRPVGSVTPGTHGYVLDGRLNDSFRAVNLLWNEGIAVRRADPQDRRDPPDGSDAGGAGDGVRPGDFLVSADAPEAALGRIAEETGVDFAPLEVEGTGRPIERQRVGMYHRYRGGNMDEGWTRLLLENFGFPYDSLQDVRILEGDLGSSYDVVILPDDSPAMMLGPDEDDLPEVYRSGFGEEGVEALDAFVRGGGTLVTFARAGELAIEGLELPVRNVVDGLSSMEFWSPGSTLQVRVDTDHPVAYGLPSRALATFLQGNHAYEVVLHDENERVDRVVTFPARDILQSGWLLGEDAIAGKAAVVSVRHGEGRVVLIGFRAQHRHQTHGTFKLIFNALIDGAGVRAEDR